MKKLYIFALAFATSTYSLMAADITLTVSSFDAETPIDVKVGDVITFITGSTHPVRQVSETDWNNDAKTLLPGGIDITTSSTNKTYTVKESDKGTMYLICVNHVSFMKTKLMVSGTTSLNTTTTASFNVFPNPTLGVLNLSTSGTYDVEVTTMNGSAVTEMFTVGNSIDLSALPKGEYLVRFKNENNLVVRKVIKK